MDEMKHWTPLLRRMIAAEASDLHAAAGQCVQLRQDGMLVPETFVPVHGAVEDFLRVMLTAEQYAACAVRDVDFSWQSMGRRFRGHAYRTAGGAALSLRLLPAQIRTPEEIGMPAALRALAGMRDGLALICGATGAGKTTTLAALIGEINRTRAVHIITLEDPIEYVFAPARAFLSQREMGRDFDAFPCAVRSALREDPDILLIGEIRDRATMEAALTAAATGVLVLGTLHTRSAAQTALRVESMFPAEMRDAVRAQFADTVTGIFAQRLLPRRGGGRAAAFEVLAAVPAVRNLLRQGSYAQLTSVMMSGAAQGMQTQEMAEAALRAQGILA